MQKLDKIMEEIDAIKTGFDTECRSECDLYDWSCGACVGECDEYIKERVKDIIRKHMNDGWIPVEERLPEVDVDIAETFEDDDCPEYNVTIRGTSESTTLKYSPDGTWFDQNGYVYDVIAWRPLPEPYHPESEKEKPDWRQDMLRKFDRRD